MLQGHQQHPTVNHLCNRSLQLLRLFHPHHKDHLVDLPKALLEPPLHLKPPLLKLHPLRLLLPHQPLLNNCLPDPLLHNLSDLHLQIAEIVQ